MQFDRVISLYLDDCHSRQLRPKTLQSYEQAVRLFGKWLEDQYAITQVEEVRDLHVRSYINDLQSQGQYTYSIDPQKEQYNQPQHRRDCTTGIITV